MVGKQSEAAIDPAIRAELEALTSEFSGIFSQEAVRICLEESYASLPRGPIATYRSALAKRFARERLRAAAQAQGHVAKTAPEVLFVCVHNAGRSQMAAALTAKLSEGKVHVRSAGSTPASEINQAVVQAMAEVGIDISQEFAKPLTDDVIRAADVVITMGCGDTCPVYPGKRYLDWAVDDPAGKTVEEVRPIRTEIEDHVRSLLRELDLA